MSNSPSTTYLTARCCQNFPVATDAREPSAAGRKPPAQINTTDSKCNGSMKVAAPSTAANVEKGSIQTADNCINGVITVLEVELKALSVQK
mmetsp:Transcript_75698/g.133664  ORF Transcript_75698/g.133664 Transcript_75698/m.133664 type:complete len:91 (+) Transcript_75698:539-811(+)